MRHAKRAALNIAALALLQVLALAGVLNGGSYVDLDGGTVTVSSTTHHIANVTRISVTDSNGGSTTADGDPTVGGCNGETDDSGTMTSCDGAGADCNSFRAKNGKLQQKNDAGDWKTLGKKNGGTPQPAGDDGDGGCKGSSPPPPSSGDTIGTHPDTPTEGDEDNLVGGDTIGTLPDTPEGGDEVGGGDTIGGHPDTPPGDNPDEETGLVMVRSSWRLAA